MIFVDSSFWIATQFSRDRHGDADELLLRHLGSSLVTSNHALTRSLRINDALAFDGDFAAAGFVELRP